MFIRSFFKPRITDILGSSALTFHVLPNDLDLNGHMNNGRYATLMDIGRLDMVLRNGLMRVMMKDKSIPVLGSIQMRFRIPLHLWQTFRLETRVICWDDKWIYLEQKFVIAKGKKAGAIAAIGLIKGGFYNTKERITVPTQDLLDILGVATHSPDFPAYVTDWVAAEESFRETTKSTEA